MALMVWGLKVGWAQTMSQPISMKRNMRKSMTMASSSSLPDWRLKMRMKVLPSRAKTDLMMASAASNW